VVNWIYFFKIFFFGGMGDENIRLGSKISTELNLILNVLMV